MSEIRTWRYQVPNEKHQGWAILFLDSIGCFAALSDYGDYAYRWPQAGWGPGDFRRFLLSCDRSYLFGKLAPRDEYDGQETLKLIRERIVEKRREGGLTKEQARAEMDLLEEHDLDSEDGFSRWMDDTILGDAWEMACQSPPAQAVAFMDRCLPRLRALIEAELKEEGGRP